MSVFTVNAFLTTSALVVLLAACSQNDPAHPASITDCQGTGAQCGVGSNPGSGSDTPSTDGGTGGGVDSGLSCGTITIADPGCQSCRDRACCTPAITCSGNTECLAYTNCLQSCALTNQPCVAGCQNLHMTGLAAYNGYFSCLQTNCGGACALVDAAVSCGNILFGGQCDACVSVNCCGQAELCSNDPDCQLYSSCIQICAPNDSTCRANCQMLSPTGSATYASLAQCIIASCASQCQ